MRGKSYSERAPAAYCRQRAQQKRSSIPLEELPGLPSRTCEETLEERDSVMVRHGARTLAHSA
jgi:hypothetical protein